MKKEAVEISEQERIQLGGELAECIYNFFRNQEPVASVEGNRRAAEKTALVAGRVAAAVMHPGKVDGEYLMLSRRLETTMSAEMKSTIDSVIKGWIRPVQPEGGGQ